MPVAPNSLLLKLLSGFVNLHWYKFTLLVAIAALAIWLEPKTAIGFIAGLFARQLDPVSKP